jgi:hypothetical protein
MTQSLRKKIVTSVTNQWKIRETIELLDILLILMKKFWKQLSQIPIQWFFKDNYSEVYQLYILLGFSRCTIKDCLLLKQKLQQSMLDNSFIAAVSDISITNTIKNITSDSMILVWWDINNPVLSIQSPKKVYRRSLAWDLHKLLF